MTEGRFVIYQRERAVAADPASNMQGRLRRGG